MGYTLGGCRFNKLAIFVLGVFGHQLFKAHHEVAHPIETEAQIGMVGTVAVPTLGIHDVSFIRGKSNLESRRDTFVIIVFITIPTNVHLRPRGTPGENQPSTRLLSNAPIATHPL